MLVIERSREENAGGGKWGRGVRELSSNFTMLMAKGKSLGGDSLHENSRLASMTERLANQVLNETQLLHQDRNVSQNRIRMF